MTRDPIFTFADHVVSTSFANMPEEAVSAAKTFTLDTLGVGISGGAGPLAAELAASAAAMGAGSDARLWGTGQPLPASSAAMCNAWSIMTAMSLLPAWWLKAMRMAWSPVSPATMPRPWAMCSW